MAIYHSWNGTVLTITSDSGTSSADLKGEMGIRGPQGAQGAQGEVDTSRLYTKDVPPTPAEVGAVPETRKINNKELSKDITLTAADVGARSSSWLPTAEEVSAAPSGFGLGTNAVTISDIDSVYKTGFYKWDSRPSGAPFSYAVMEVIARADGSCIQIVYGMASTNADIIAKRRGNANTGEWQEWEYYNPLLSFGVPYKTTERWNSKPVYAILLNMGTMPSSSSKSVDSGIAVSTYQIVDSRLSLINASGNYGRTSTKDTLDYYFDGMVSGKTNWQATVVTTSYYADYNGCLLIKYVKK